MGVKIRRISTWFFENRGTVLLAFFWFLGLFLGFLLAANSSTSYYSLMRSAACHRVTIVGLTAAAYLPFLLTAYAVYLGKASLVYLCCFAKAVSFACCAGSCLLAFGSGGWLVRLMMQFTDILLVPVFCWFSLRQISGSGMLKKDFFLCSALYILAGTLDYCLVSPFLVTLIDH